MGTVVCAANDIKLISLGEAKYIEPLDYENQVLAFEKDWLGGGVARAIGSKRAAHSCASSPPAPHPSLSLDVDQSFVYVHPALRFVSTQEANTCGHECAHQLSFAHACATPRAVFLTFRTECRQTHGSHHRPLLLLTTGHIIPHFPPHACCLMLRR